ncbi:MAG: HEPN domain-containing protein [Bacteroidales bacterium]|nr:HEPN domain-containing protein [Bacteroidales bacterium]
MKDTFDPESKKALINYRIERAYETLKEAKYNADGGFYYAAINRLYYACFYAVIALLLKHDITSQTHQGARAMLGLHFVSKGKLSKENGKTFHDLFEKRHSGDYDDFVLCDQEMVDELYPKAVQFIEDIKDLL